MAVQQIISSDHFYKNRKSSGYNLLELMFILLVFSIVLAAGVPLLTDTISRFSAESGMRNFRNLVSYARAEAIVRKADVVICPRTKNALTCHSAVIADENEESQVWQRGWLLFVDRGNSPTTIDASDGDLLLKAVDAIGGDVIIKMTGSTGGGNLSYIRFLSRGSSYPSSLSALFCISKGGSVLYAGKVVISRGRSRLEDSATAKTECPV